MKGIILLGLVLTLTIALSQFTSAETCYAKLNDLPANCTGTISSDVKGGCRTIACNAPNGNVQVQACEKTDSAGRYFEIYRQSSTGTQPQVCIGSNCLKSGWGYQKGSYFPICVGTTSPPVNPPNTTNGTNSTPNNQTTQVCKSAVNDIPASCEGGTITQDTKGGCRTIVCTNGGNSIKVMACNKPDGGSPQYFEMYRQSITGSPPKICIGTTCLQNEGYKKSTNYPYCFRSPPDTPPNSTNNTTTSSVKVTVDSAFPQGQNYVFLCNVSGFTPKNYTWTFSDGTSVVRNATRYAPYQGYPNDRRPNNDVFHTFPGNGTYSATCKATDGVSTAQSSVQVQVSTPVIVQRDYPFATYASAAHVEGITYRLQCNAAGYPPDVAWRVTKIVNNSGTTVYDYGPYGSPSQKDILLNLTPGDYDIACTTRTYDSRYVPQYYEDNYIEPSSSFGVMSSSTYFPFVAEGDGALCYTNVSTLRGRCENSDLVSSEFVNGCQEFVCRSATGRIKVKACDQPAGSANPYYFQMFKIEKSGYGPNFCLGETCFVNSDYARSQDAIC